jgi:hypothetical protein
MIWLSMKVDAAWEGVLIEWQGDLAEDEGGWGLERGFGWVRRWFGSEWRQMRLGKRFWVGEEVILLRVKAGEAWEEVSGRWGVDLAQDEDGCGLGRGFGWVRRWFGSGWRQVRLWMGFWVGEEVIWLRVKSDEAWKGVLGRWGGDFAQGEGGWGLGRGFG